jgi:hypothetical protein
MTTTITHSIHVKNLFKIFLPWHSTSAFTAVPLPDAAGFGFALMDSNSTVSFKFLIRLFSSNESNTADMEIMNGLEWAKRIPLTMHYNQNSSATEGIIIHIKISHHAFDFRKIKQRTAVFIVDCFGLEQATVIQRGASSRFQLLPKRRQLKEDDGDYEEVTLPLAWIPNQTAEESPNNTSPYYHHHEDGDIFGGGSEESMQLSDSHASESEQTQQTFNNNYQDNNNREMINFSIADQGSSPESNGVDELSDDNYMVLYNGNAEVIGNFRALNFYKASDINIKEDIRLLSEDFDCREVLLRIDGVAYKFKPGVHANVNKRFVGYIAQQVESVVPEAVQLIDGILHVDYESLIPYLSESIRQNFNDIKNIKADNEKLHFAMNAMYDTFVNKKSGDKSNDASDRFSSMTVAQKQKQKLSKVSTAIIVIIVLAAILSGACAIYYFSTQHNIEEPQNPTIPLSPVAPNGPHTNPPITTPTPPTPPQHVPVPIAPPIIAPTAPPVDPPVPVDDTLLVLESIYTTMNGPYWRNQDNWMTNTSYCSWYGIRCFMGRVDVKLNKNNLTGTLPSQLGELLGTIDLGNNLISGEIPESLYNNKRINALTLNDNLLTGTISEKIGELQFMIKLDLSNNNFTGTLPSVLNRTQLNRLIIQNNRLEGSFPWFPKLLTGDIFNNAFSGKLPPFFPNLAFFNGAGNLFEGSLEFPKPTKIRMLDVSDNKLSGSVGLFNGDKFPELRSMNISHNQFSGDITNIIQMLKDHILMDADMSYNHFTSMNYTGGFLQMNVCEASNNDFECPLPDWFIMNCHATCIGDET